jgi:hypothetical protein
MFTATPDQVVYEANFVLRHDETVLIMEFIKGMKFFSL